MAYLDQKNFDVKSGSGVQNLIAGQFRSHHTITVSSESSISVSIMAHVHGHDGLIEFGENTLQSGKTATFILPGAVSFQITPSDSGATFTASVQSF